MVKRSIAPKLAVFMCCISAITVLHSFCRCEAKADGSRVIVAERGHPRPKGNHKDANVAVSLPLGEKLTPKNLGAALKDTSNESCEIILSIIELNDADSASHVEAQLDEVQNFVTHLSDVGRAHNLLLIGTDDRTCSLLRERSIPCHEDHNSAGWVPDADNLNPHRRVSLLKWWFSAAIVEAGYHVLYMDIDVIVTDDVLDRWIHDGHGSYDFQGLSAIDNLSSNRDFSKLQKACPVLDAIPGRNAARFSAPCMSTALFYAEAQPSTKALLRGMVTAITLHPGEWEMLLFQEVVISFLVGEADSPLLKFRILDVKHFCPFNVYSLRKRERLPLKPAAIYMGSIPQGQKHDAVLSLGKWRPHNWDHGSVGRTRAASILTRDASLNSEEKRSAWLAALKAPPGTHIFADKHHIGYIN